LVIQRAPDVELFAQKLLGWGVMSDVDSSLTGFERGTGLTGFRGDMRPSAEFRLPLGPSLFASLHGAFRETAYGLTQNTMQNGFTGEDPATGEIMLPSTSSRQIFELRGDVGTQVSRVFDFPYFGFDKVKHTIEPLVKYMYIPPVNQDDLPVFDGIDRINKRSLVTYGVMSRLYGREESDSLDKHGEVRELADISATQSYDFLRQIPPTTRLDDVSGQPIDPQPGNNFSDIDFAVGINPTTVTTIGGTATYNPEDNRLSSASAGIRFREPHRVFGQDIRPRLLTRASLNVQYRFITDNIVQLLDSTFALPITDRIAGLYTMRYDINVGSFLENYIGVRLLSSCDCWALNLGLTQTRNPNEVQVHAQFTLAGLGNSKLGGLRDY
jgi:LPS-assembly protein